MRKRELGERISFIWLVIVTVIIVCGAFLISDTLKDKTVETICVTVEHFESGHGEVHETKSSEHVEELDNGLLIDEKSLEILSRIIHGESGSNWCSDQMQLYVGSVFLNRVASEHFPNTFEEVAFQEGQYSCTRKGSGYWQEPTERDIANARYLLENGSQLEANYLWQSQYKQGTDIIKVQNMYFGRRK
jgi:hypothetical protein